MDLYPPNRQPADSPLAHEDIVEFTEGTASQGSFEPALVDTAGDADTRRAVQDIRTALSESLDMPLAALNQEVVVGIIESVDAASAPVAPAAPLTPRQHSAFQPDVRWLALSGLFAIALGGGSWLVWQWLKDER